MDGFLVRRAQEIDAFEIIEAHHAAIREKAHAYYPPIVINQWAPKQITDDIVT